MTRLVQSGEAKLYAIWEVIPEGLTANFSISSGGDYGSLTTNKVNFTADQTTFTANENTVVIADAKTGKTTTVTATPKVSDVQYTYLFGA